MRCPFCHTHLPRKEVAKFYRCPRHGELSKPHDAITETEYRHLIGANHQRRLVLKEGDLVAFSFWPGSVYRIGESVTGEVLKKVQP